MANEEILYDDGKIRVVYWPKTDSHGLIIRNQLIFLQHGILEELATTPNQNLIGKFHSIDPGFDYLLETENLSYSTIGLIIAQARINELEKKLGSSYKIIPHHLPKIIPVPK